MEVPPVRYLTRPFGHLAWQSWGDGPLTILDCGVGGMFSLDDMPDEPRWLRYVTRLASFGRVLRLDYPGIGLSDSARETQPSMRDNALNAIAVLDAAGEERAAVLGAIGDGMVAMYLAALHPERVSSLVLVNPSARVTWAPDYPQGISQETVNGWQAAMEPNVFPVPDDEGETDLRFLAPSASGDPAFRSWWVRSARRGASPSVAAAANRDLFTADLRPLLGRIACPALIVQRSALPLLGASHGRAVADGIPGARYIELPGSDQMPFIGDSQTILDEVQEFLTGQRWGPQEDRVFAVVMFTDIVSSTATAVRLGDTRWRAILLDHKAIVERELQRHGGVLVQDLGDGTLSTFASPGQAVRCALALRDAVRHLGVDLRAGLHGGEITLRGKDIAGINVHVAARVAALAGEGEVLVSSTVVELVAGSSLTFSDRGRHALKGVPGQRQVWAVTS